MKKHSVFLILIIIGLVFLNFISPVLVAKADRQFDINNYEIIIHINTDGSADIEELITYDFDGNFNGVTRDIDISEIGGITDYYVFVDKDGAQREFNLDNSEATGTYTFKTEGNMVKFKVFEKSTDELKTFIYKYKLLDVVTRYNDIAEFNRKVIDKEWQATLNNISINVKLPEGAVKEDIKVFAHGPLTGVSEIIDERNTLFTVPYVTPGTFVETRVLFPTKLVPQIKNIVQSNALDEIMRDEGNLADEANREREDARKYLENQENERMEKHLRIARLKPFGTTLTVLLFILGIFIFYKIYTKYDKEHNSSFHGKYYRELPGDYSPAEMSYLMSSGSINSRDIMATIMDLVRKKQLLLNPYTYQRKGLFSSKTKNTYAISINSKAPSIALKDHETYLIDWFINEIGDTQTVTLDEIKEYVKSNKNSLKFKSDYDDWCEVVCAEAEKLNFFDLSLGKGKLLGALSGILFIGVGIAIVALLYSPYAISLLILGLVLLIYSVTIRRRTVYGNDQYRMWKALKNFLKDFSNMEKAQLPSIILWEHYLVYAISLGVAKEVIKQLPIVFTDTELDNNNLTFLYGSSFGYFSGFSNMFDNTISTVESAVSKATEIASSVNSSGSGSGGGFSGGSSGGSGGGGGGGAF